MRSKTLITLMIVFVVGQVSAAAPSADGPAREVRAHSIALTSRLPVDLTAPEGRSRWDLTSVAVGESFTASTTPIDGAVRVVETRSSGATKILWGEEGASRWLLPDRSVPLRMGTRDSLTVDRIVGDRVERFRIETEIVGIGWVELPSGPREVVLQRAVVLVRAAGSDALEADRLVHRWIDPRSGVVAEVSGPSAADGRSRLSLDGGFLVDEVLAGAADLKIYVDQLYFANDNDLNVGWDRGAVAISTLTPDGFATIGDLINKPDRYWDFSANTGGLEVSQVDTAVNSAETCNYNQCGYGVTGGQLGRQDKFNAGTLDRKDNQVTTRENRAGDVTIWVWAGAQKEGKSGVFGTGESRYCYQTFGGRTRTPVPLWRFSHNDAGGWFMQPGDLWQNATAFNCEQNLFQTTCGSPGFPSELYAKACGTHTGRQSGEALWNGVVKIPSGHTFNAMLIRTVADFCVYTDSFCLLKVDEVRTVVYLWQVPAVGSAVLLQSAQNPADLTSWTQTENTIITFGIYPPLSITATGQTDTSVSLSWNPGNDTHRINGYRIYWDTDSGSASSYAFNSDTHPGQVSVAGTTATISGLAPGTTYYVTVTSKSNYTDPSSNITRTYESLKYPTQVSGDPNFVYPVEVQATTTGGCLQPTEVTGLTLDKVPGGARVAWDSQDASAGAATNYDVVTGVLADLRSTGSFAAATCLRNDQADTPYDDLRSDPPAGTGWYYLVRAQNACGDGTYGRAALDAGSPCP